MNFFPFLRFWFFFFLSVKHQGQLIQKGLEKATAINEQWLSIKMRVNISYFLFSC
jgi:hypothetical protein